MKIILNIRNIDLWVNLELVESVVRSASLAEIFKFKEDRDSFGILRFFNLNLQLQSSTNVDDSFEGKIEFALES